MELKEFFIHALKEGPRDPAFKPAPEVKPGDGLPPEDEPIGGMPAEDEPLTQDVAAMSNSSLSFFSKNVQSAVSKFNLEQEGFNTQALQEFATSLDELVFQMYQGAGDPKARQDFEVDYQKVAADWSKDLTKLFDKILKLKGHTAQY